MNMMTLADAPHLYVVTWATRDEREAYVYDEDEGEAAAFVSLLDPERFVALRSEECPDASYQIVPFAASRRG